LSPPVDPRFLALLVKRGLLDVAAVRDALASPDPVGTLVAKGLVTPQRWDEWVRTDAGQKPELTRYELLELLGEGGTARVWRARDRKSGEQLALKILDPALARDPAAAGRFVQESKLLGELSSPHLVRGHRVAREGDVIYCAMELVHGRSLQEQLAAGGRLPEADALEIVAQIADALTALHARGLVHRDVKPGNILWGEDRRAVLIDLGFAVASGGGGAGDTTAGTAAYIAPEQARGGGLDLRADIYSLGATLYHLVTGALPFEGASSDEILRRQVLDALSGDAIRRLGLAPQTHYFIEKMMAKEKEIRFQSPAQLAAEIRTDLARRAREAAPAPPAKPRKRRRWL
jgi:serine/threonine-protein kinase